MSAKAALRLGQIVTTPNVLRRIASDDILSALQRHQAGDWGDVKDDDRKANDRALIEGERILSVHHSVIGIKIWIMTERDRSVTTILLPEDY